MAFVAHHMQVQVHQHTCYQVLVGLDEPFASTIDDVVHANTYGLIMNREVPHACRAVEGSALVYFVDPHSEVGDRVKQVVGDARFVRFNPRLFFDTESVPTAKNADPQQWRVFADHLLGALTAAHTHGAPSYRDPRMMRAVQYVESHLGDSLLVRHVAEHVGLSPERTRHLFAQEIGSPLSQFVRWTRIKQCVRWIVRDQLSLSVAAARAGFSDQAHFCRTFKRTFGVSASGLLKNSRFVQFIHP